MTTTGNYIVYLDGKHSGVVGFSGHLPCHQQPEQRLQRQMRQLHPGKTVTVRRVTR